MVQRTVKKRGEGSLPRIIRSAMWSVVLDTFRRTHYTRGLPKVWSLERDEIPEDTFIDEHATPQQPHIAAEILNVLHDAVESLGEVQAAILIALVEGYRPRDLGIDSRKLYAIKVRARAAVRASMQARGISFSDIDIP